MCAGVSFPLAVLTLYWVYTLYSLSRKTDSKANKRALGEALGYTALFLELILPSTSTTIAETFVCDQLGDERFLRADLTIACDGGEGAAQRNGEPDLRRNLGALFLGLGRCQQR